MFESLLLLLSLTSARAAPSGPAAGATVERRVALMGTSLDLTIEAGDRATALAASELAVRTIEAADGRLSTWREDSELTRLNRTAAGDPVQLSPALAADLAAARRCWEITEGAFDPSVGPLVEAWGLRTGGRLPSTQEIAAARSHPLPGLEMRGSVAVRRDAGLRLEEGGFGKGAALRDAVARLERASGVRGGLLDFGGQVAAFGRPPGKGWRIAVADPAARQRVALEVEIDGGSLSTSGNGERGLRVQGRKVGHLLDPRTGAPAEDFGSLTVWARDPLFADCLSTGLFVLGPARALAWAESHPEVEVLVLRQEGRTLAVRATAGLRGRLHALAQGTRLELETSRPGSPHGAQRPDRNKNGQ